MKNQKIIELDSCENLTIYIQDLKIHRIMLVHGNSFFEMSWKRYFEELPVEIVHFMEFGANPIYESVINGRKEFLEQQCDAIVAVGGGSAIDVAKSIKLFANMDDEKNFLHQEIIPNNIPIIAIPTTAGTGSESTSFAVIYYKGEKKSIEHESILPDIAVLDERVLKTLPEYQKKVTLCDALAHGIEAYWSVNATDESRKYSKEAVESIICNWKEYLACKEGKNREMLLAANKSGKAINIAKTTAGHAMSYKITSMFSVPHGQAVIVGLPILWRHMLLKCNDEQKKIFEEISAAMQCETIDSAIAMLEYMIEDMGLCIEVIPTSEQIEELAVSVNPLRLKNNPIEFNINELREIYKEIFKVSDF